jgi:hypothetical protein
MFFSTKSNEKQSGTKIVKYLKDYLNGYHHIPEVFDHLDDYIVPTIYKIRGAF